MYQSGIFFRDLTWEMDWQSSNYRGDTVMPRPNRPYHEKYQTKNLKKKKSESIKYSFKLISSVCIKSSLTSISIK